MDLIVLGYEDVEDQQFGVFTSRISSSNIRSSIFTFLGIGLLEVLLRNKYDSTYSKEAHKSFLVKLNECKLYSSSQEDSIDLEAILELVNVIDSNYSRAQISTWIHEYYLKRNEQNIPNRLTSVMKMVILSFIEGSVMKQEIRSSQELKPGTVSTIFNYFCSSFEISIKVLQKNKRNYTNFNPNFEGNFPVFYLLEEDHNGFSYLFHSEIKKFDCELLKEVNLKSEPYCVFHKFPQLQVPEKLLNQDQVKLQNINNDLSENLFYKPSEKPNEMPQNIVYKVPNIPENNRNNNPNPLAYSQIYNFPYSSDSPQLADSSKAQKPNPLSRSEIMPINPNENPLHNTSPANKNLNSFVPLSPNRVGLPAPPRPLIRITDPEKNLKQHERKNDLLNVSKPEVNKEIPISASQASKFKLNIPERSYQQGPPDIARDMPKTGNNSNLGKGNQEIPQVFPVRNSVFQNSRISPLKNSEFKNPAPLNPSNRGSFEDIISLLSDHIVKSKCITDSLINSLKSFPNPSLLQLESIKGILNHKQNPVKNFCTECRQSKDNEDFNAILCQNLNCNICSSCRTKSNFCLGCNRAYTEYEKSVLNVIGESFIRFKY